MARHIRDFREKWILRSDVEVFFVPINEALSVGGVPRIRVGVSGKTDEVVLRLGIFAYLKRASNLGKVPAVSRRKSNSHHRIFLSLVPQKVHRWPCGRYLRR